MPRAQRPWFRFYVEAMRDPKMRRLTPSERWLWVAVLAAARESCISGYLLIAEGEPYTVEDLADYAGMKPKEVAAAIPKFEKLGLIETDRNIGAWCVRRWTERQYESDDVTKRTRNHRSKEPGRNVPTSGLGTPPETETETDLSPNPTADAVGDEPSRPPGNSRAHGTNPRAIAERQTEERTHIERFESARRWGINAAALYPDRISLDDALRANDLEGELAVAAIDGWESARPPSEQGSNEAAVPGVAEGGPTVSPDNRFLLSFATKYSHRDPDVVRQLAERLFADPQTIARAIELCDAGRALIAERSTA